MNKELEQIYTIKEVADKTGFKPHVIRFYEKEFNLDIPRTENNRRYFTHKEVEYFLYIKDLQNQGLSNKQIKRIFESNNQPKESIYNAEIAVTSIIDNNEVNHNSSNNLIHEILIQMQEKMKLALEKYDHTREIEELSNKIDELKSELNSKDKDVLVCENAKLKLKIKEKSYEVAQLKEELKRQQHQKKSFFYRLFK